MPNGRDHRLSRFRPAAVAQQSIPTFREVEEGSGHEGFVVGGILREEESGPEIGA